MTALIPLNTPNIEAEAATWFHAAPKVAAVQPPGGLTVREWMDLRAEVAA